MIVGRLEPLKRDRTEKRLFLEQAEGYVKALEESTSPLSTMTEVFDHCVQTGLARELSCGRKTVA